MARLIVIGAGPAGLGAALFSARRGHTVVLVERDAEGPPADADACFEAWNRRGVGQFRQGHQFLALACKVLMEEAPEVLAEVSYGAVVLPFMDAAPGDPPVILSARRTTFERVLRRAVERQPGVELRAGVAVEGLIARADGPVPRVTGVRLAGGRRSRATLSSTPRAAAVTCAGGSPPSAPGRRRRSTRRWASPTSPAGIG